MSEVLVVHCVDTEGPLDETIEASFERLKEIFGVVATPSRDNLQLIQQKQAPFVPNSLTEAVAKAFSPKLLAYNRNWDAIESELDLVFSPDFRSNFLDSYGNPWTSSWFVMSHEDYTHNPRRKAVGPGVVHDRYHQRLRNHPEWSDEIQLHFHPSSVGGNPLAGATSYVNSLPRLAEDLALRLHRFQWFPSAFRPGFHSLRPDSHLWLEQWFPFDFGNQSHDIAEDQPDLALGRFGDWRRAPKTWQGYNPSLSDYQEPGDLKRTIFRCLNLGTRLRELRQENVYEAFREAGEHGSAVLAFTNHDFRPMTPDVKTITDFLRVAQKRFPEVKVRFANASEAARRHLGLDNSEPHLALRMQGEVLEVSVKMEELHSHQPFLSIETRDGRFLSDNLDRGLGLGSFRYTFDAQTIPLGLVKAIGVAVVGSNGRVTVQTIQVEDLA